MNTKRLATVLCAAWLSANGAADAQVVGRGSTVEGDILRGQGVLLSGAGWYNLRTAQANAINTETVIRWKQDLRKIQQERLVQEAQKKYDKNKNVEELKQQIRQREQKLRTDPKPEDVQSGAALNALVYDLMDPDIKYNQWGLKSIDLPPGTSVKELIFSFTPHSVSTQASAALSKGVIALSRLDIKGKWPDFLKKNELTKEREAYEWAYLRVRDKVLKEEYAVDEILGLNTALNALQSKVNVEIPPDMGYRAEATNFVNDLRAATRMFDAKTIEYAKEILLDTKDHDATTVQELVEFMSKYRLQFANSERSPKASKLYREIYEKLSEQAAALGLKVEATTFGSLPSIPDPSAPPKSSAKAGREIPAQRGSGVNEPVGDPGFLPLNAAGRPVNLNFENGSLDGWKLAGQAFVGQPVKGTATISKRGKKSNHTGEYWIGGFEFKGDRPQGTLTSEIFMVSHPFASYLIGGGLGKDTRVEIVRVSDGSVFHKASGRNVEAMQPVIVNMETLLGDKVFVRIVDEKVPDGKAKTGWGHINFDDFRFHRASPKFN